MVEMSHQISEIAKLLHMTPAGAGMAAPREAKAADQKLVEQLPGG